jgi:hypothetical protein
LFSSILEKRKFKERDKKIHHQPKMYFRRFYTSVVAFLFLLTGLKQVEAGSCISQRRLESKLSYLSGTAVYTTATYVGINSACNVFAVPRIPALDAEDCKNIARIAACITGWGRTYFEERIQARMLGTPSFRDSEMDEKEL